MKIVYRRIREIVQLLFFRFENRNKHCIIGENVKLDKNTNLEGYNRICQNTRIGGTVIGLGTYIGWNSVLNNGEIGRFCSIAPFVECIYGRHPLYPRVSTHPSFYSSNWRQAGFTFVKEQHFVDAKRVKSNSGNLVSFIIGNDVWIGYGARLMQGIEIGDGAVVAAGAIVTKNVPPFEIWGGIPAKKIADRFHEKQKQALEKIQWWNNDFSYFKENVHLFENIEEFLTHNQ